MENFKWCIWEIYVLQWHTILQSLQRYDSFQEKYFTLILQTAFYQLLLIVWLHLYVLMSDDWGVMLLIFYFSNCELWPFKNIPAGILFKLQIVFDFVLAVNILMPIQCGTTNGKIQQISCQLSLYGKEFLPYMRQSFVIHLCRHVHDVYI